MDLNTQIESLKSQFAKQSDNPEFKMNLRRKAIANCKLRLHYIMENLEIDEDTCKHEIRSIEETKTYLYSKMEETFIFSKLNREERNAYLNSITHF
jgi:hypothetical protein